MARRTGKALLVIDERGHLRYGKFYLCKCCNHSATPIAVVVVSPKDQECAAEQGRKRRRSSPPTTHRAMELALSVDTYRPQYYALEFLNSIRDRYVDLKLSLHPCGRSLVWSSRQARGFASSVRTQHRISISTSTTFPCTTFHSSTTTAAALLRASLHELEPTRALHRV